MTYNKYLFSTLSKAPASHVELGNGNKAEIIGSGTIMMNIIVSGKAVPVKLENMFLVPELGST